MEFSSILIILLLGTAYLLFIQPPPSSPSHSFSQNIVLMNQFTNWKQKYHRRYFDLKEEFLRIKVFKQNLKRIEAHNSLYQKKKVSYKMALNQFGDLTPTEFISYYTTRLSSRVLPSISLNLTQNCSGSIMDPPNPPQTIDWQNKLSTPVQDQQKCGKDWAMASAAAIQGLYALRTGAFVGLSSQQLVECSGSYGNEGCFGGYMEQAYWYVIDNGIANNISYPFRPEDTNQIKCSYVQGKKFTTIGRCARVPAQNYSKFLGAVVQQPITVAINVSQDLEFYSEGIFEGPCDPEDLNHGILVTGYGSQEGKQYWRLRNSYGTSWGEKGYLRLKRITDETGPGTCGILLLGSAPQNIP